MRRAGRPGLLGTMARTAVVVGTAKSVSNSMDNSAASKQEAEAAQIQAQLQQQQAQASQNQIDTTAKLHQLADLHKSGALSNQEFEAAKKQLLQAPS